MARGERAVERELHRQLYFVMQLVRRRWRHVERLAAALLEQRTMHEDDLRPFVGRQGLAYPKRFLIESERLNRGRYACAVPTAVA